jgi:LDH2 family malate/lactate/ureidoglycolate dehydrogenase
MTTDVARVPMVELLELACSVLSEVGMREADASVLARSLVEADATGLGTHGVIRLGAYVSQLRGGQVNPRPDEKLVCEGSSFVLVDADRGFGAPVGMRTVDALMTKARETGVAVGGVRRVAHFGTAGFYTRQASESGFLAVAMSSSSPSVVPFGGRGPRIGNSPMSFSTPGVDGPELLLDMAQSTTSRGRIKLAMDAGERIPTTWAVDSMGESTDDPAAALGGAVLPSGGHKGSAMSLMVEMLASGLTGANLSQEINHAGFTSTRGPDGDTTDVTVGNFYLVIDADVFGDAEGVRHRATRIADHVRASEPAPGFDRVRVPGDPESSRLEQAQTRGVELSRQTRQALDEVAELVGIRPLFTERHDPRSR